MLKKIFTLVLLVLLTNVGFAQYPTKTKLDRPVGYSTAITWSNPLSGSTKYGGGIEHRYGNFATMASYYRYKGGAYPGAMADFDMRLYMKNRWLVGRQKRWSYQSFIYLREFAGIAAFDGSKLEPFGYPKNVSWPEEVYYGAASGYGRRYNRGWFFVAFKAGIRYAKIVDLDEDAKHMYRVFFVTGPGSIFEFNIQYGIQLF